MLLTEWSFLVIIGLMQFYSVTSVPLGELQDLESKDEIIEPVQDGIAIKSDAYHRDKRQFETTWPKQKLKNVTKTNVECTNPGEYETCAPCPIGYYKNKRSPKKECARCGSGTGTPTEGATRCIKLCKAGEKLLDDDPKAKRKCGKCAEGTYQPAPSLNKTCIACPKNWVTAKEGSKQFSDCFLNCSAGWQPNIEKTDCIPCPDGKYKSKAGSDSCQVCPKNKTTLEDGALMKNECKVRCDHGKEYNNATNRCDKCGPGTYKPEHSSRLRCRPCPEDLVPNKNKGATKCIVPPCPSCASCGEVTLADPPDPTSTVRPEPKCPQCTDPPPCPTYTSIPDVTCPACPPIAEKTCPTTAACPKCIELTCPTCPTTTSCPEVTYPTTTPCPEVTCPATTPCAEVICPTTTPCPEVTCPTCLTHTEPPLCPEVLYPTTTPRPEVTCPSTTACPICPTCPTTTQCPEVTCPTTTACPTCPTCPTTTPCPQVTCPTTTACPTCPTCPTTTPCPEVTCPTTTACPTCPTYPTTTSRPEITCPTPTEPPPCPARPCPDGWSQLGDFCYFYVRSLMNWNQAEESCNLMGGHLAVVDNQETNQFLFSLFSQFGDSEYGPWVGARQSGGRWIWDNTGTEATYTTWNPGEPNGGIGDNCIHYYRHSGIGWNDVACGGLSVPSLCEMKQVPSRPNVTPCPVVTSPTPIETPPRQCFASWREFGGSCILYIPTLLDWYEADKLCHAMGGYLAEVDGPEKDQFLFSLFSQAEATGYGPWIGGHYYGDQWMWKQSTAKATYTNWNQGEPSWGESGENCIHYYLHTGMGWNDAVCKTHHLFPSLCEMKHAG